VSDPNNSIWGPGSRPLLHRRDFTPDGPRMSEVGIVLPPIANNVYKTSLFAAPGGFCVPPASLIRIHISIPCKSASAHIVALFDYLFQGDGFAIARNSISSPALIKYQELYPIGGGQIID